MSYIKFSTNLFLEKIELQRFKKFLDDDGFRLMMLSNTIRFGLIDRQYFLQNQLNVNTLLNDFDNGLITEGASLSLDYSDILAVNSAGNLVAFDAGNIQVPADGLWYWVKIRHQYSSLEEGTVNIDTSGNLTGTNTKFLDVLRGQPNFPARIRFYNATNNVLEYDVLEVIDDTNAILENAPFAAENNLHYIVVGTFTPGSVPLSTEKEIFQYDSCLMTLEQETTLNTRPNYIDGTEFFLARVKNNGSTLVIQDKRIDIWKPKGDFRLADITIREAVTFGIEKIKYNDINSTLDKNVIYLSWVFRSTNYTVNSNLNILSIIGGNGGKYKSVNNFVNGDFDGYRAYTKDGKYAIVKHSVRVGNQINCYLDSLDIDSYSTDGGLTFTFEEVVLAPNAEEIEVIISGTGTDDSGSLANGDPLVINTRKVFPINSGFGTLELFVYDNPIAKYDISYRFKHVDIYSREFFPATGILQGYYYNETAFDPYGDFLPLVLLNSLSQNISQGYVTLYNDNHIQCLLHPSAYTNFFVGDRVGVDEVVLSNAFPLITLLPGLNRQYQHYSGTPISLTGDIFISLKKITSLNTNLKNGSYFYLHFEQPISFNTSNILIVQNYVDPTNYSLLRKIDITDEEFVTTSDRGIFLRCSYNGTNWIINSVNEYRSLLDKSTFANAVTFTTAPLTIITYVPSTSLNGNMLIIFDGLVKSYSGSSALRTATIIIRVNGGAIISKYIVMNEDGGGNPITIMTPYNYNANDIITVEAYMDNNIAYLTGQVIVQGNNLRKP